MTLRLPFPHIRFEQLIGDGGTPGDPTDDEFLEDLGVVKGSTGRNDLQGRDFCADYLLLGHLGLE